MNNGITEVLLSPKTKSIGHFPTKHQADLCKGFVLQPNPRHEAEELVKTPSLFVENKLFYTSLFKTLNEQIHLDEVYQDLVAGETKTNFFHIYDFRAPQTYGRIPDVQDILGTVTLDIGKHTTSIVPNSFLKNDMYRSVTRQGCTLVSNNIFDLLAQELKI